MPVQVLPVVCSFIFFSIVRLSVSHILPIPAAVASAKRWDITWRWYNVSVSWVHAILSGLGSLYCLIKEPAMVNGFNHCELEFAFTIVSYATGYFIYDALDIFLSNPISQSLSVLFHHFLVIACFGTVVVTKEYVPIAVVCLLVEVNSIFLHLRQLLRLSKHIHNQIYYVNMFINVATFILVRFIMLAWMTYWIWTNRATIDHPYFELLIFSFPPMIIVNIGLFIQVLTKDATLFGHFFKTAELKSNGVNCHENGQARQQDVGLLAGNKLATD